MNEIIAKVSLNLMVKKDQDLPLRTKILLWSITIIGVCGVAYAVNFVALAIYRGWCQ